ncbi:acyl-CoA dehydrogenase family protein [Alkalihalophilus marmarensis]|uniref:acyl-CoA dehydrogenase family protein n=1 Tax=Alkalihalophilus marmarensis TaxID=521377 RepID=UPI002DBF10C2|nr:acyl-CoA dehydrogenase family protein [Alkalihalophilus marmarensis]MEC2074265.1 acyl-CoA/acyl-ACP dehydrogenase [Alkalihalophilus marmarensis]
MRQINTHENEDIIRINQLIKDLERLEDVDLEILIKNNFHKAMLPTELEGLDLNIVEMSKLLTQISSKCHYSGLILSMHFYTIGSLRNYIKTSNYLKDVSMNGALFGSISNPNVQPFSTLEQINKAIGITYEKVNGKYIINGKKKYVSGAPKIRYLPIYACNEQLDNRIPVSVFIVDMNKKGVNIIEENWMSNSMTATNTFDINFNNVEVENLIFEEGKGIEHTNDMLYWFRIALSSVYLGVCEAAYQHVIALIKTKKSLLTENSVHNKVADIKIKLELARSQLLRTATMVNSMFKEKNINEIKNSTLITKYFIAETVNDILDDCLKIKGISSLDKGDFLEVLSRDAKAAYFHPPQEYKVKSEIAINELGIINFRRN